MVVGGGGGEKLKECTLGGFAIGHAPKSISTEAQYVTLLPTKNYFSHPSKVFLTSIQGFIIY
jgi:hypothetical protein